MIPVIAIPDIHGMNDHLEKILKIIHDKYPEYRLVFLGDYIDRGPDSNKVLYKIQELTKQGHVALMGNHEEFFLEWLCGGGDWYFKHPFCGDVTIDSFNKEAKQSFDYESLRRYLKYSGLLEWIVDLPFHHKDGNLVFTHAPVDQWNFGLPKSEKAAKHSFPKTMSKEDLNEALNAPDGYFAVCGHVIVGEPVLCDMGLYLDCGCGKGENSLKAAVFIDGKLIEFLDSENYEQS